MLTSGKNSATTTSGSVWRRQKQYLENEPETRVDKAGARSTKDRQGKEVVHTSLPASRKRGGKTQIS